jgi:hypothetical protein
LVSGIAPESPCFHEMMRALWISVIHYHPRLPACRYARCTSTLNCLASFDRNDAPASMDWEKAEVVLECQLGQLANIG